MQGMVQCRLVPLTLVAAGLLALGACGGRSRPAPVVEGSGSSTAPTTNAVYERALNRWIDHPEEDLVADWGVPERAQRLTDGGQALEYRRLGSAGQMLCTTLFTSDIYGMVRTWTYRGIDCRAPRLGDYGHSG
jgi:hypothetical protein